LVRALAHRAPTNANSNGGFNNYEFVVDNITITITIATVLEPSSYALVGTAVLMGLGYWWRRHIGL
jgi:hypothetical protein